MNEKIKAKLTAVISMLNDIVGDSEMEDMEEEVGEDLDGDNEEGESLKHKKKVKLLFK